MTLLTPGLCVRVADSNATDFSNGLAYGQLTTITGKMATGSLLAIIGPTEAFCGSLAAMSAFLAGGAMAVGSGAHAVAMLTFIFYKLTKSTVWTTLALVTKASFGPRLLGRVWPILTTSSRAVSFARTRDMLFRLHITGPSEFRFAGRFFLGAGCSVGRPDTESSRRIWLERSYFIGCNVTVCAVRRGMAAIGDATI